MPMPLKDLSAQWAQKFLKDAFYYKKNPLFSQDKAEQAEENLNKFGQEFPKEAKILHLRYIEQETFENIGKRLGFSKDYIKDLHREALNAFYPFCFIPRQKENQI